MREFAASAFWGFFNSIRRLRTFRVKPRPTVKATRARSGLTESRGIPKAARVRFNLLAGIEASRDGSSLFFGSAGAGCCGGGCGPDVPRGGQDVHGQRGERCEVVAAPPRPWQSGGAED